MSALDSGDLQSHPFVQPKRWGRALATGQLLLLLPVSAVRAIPWSGLLTHFLYFLLVSSLPGNGVHSFLFPSYGLHTSEQMKQGMKAVIDEPDACNSNRQIVVLVKNAVFHFPHRRAIRETWAKSAKQNHNISTLFVVARSTEQDVMDRVEGESQRHRDILMADFMDSYYNLTLKTVFALNWINRTCRPAFAAVIDDDVMLNPENLLQLTESGRVLRSVYCYLQQKKHPVRNPFHRNLHATRCLS